MASPRLVKWGGITAVLGGAATAAGAFASQLSPGNSPLSPGDYLATVLPSVAWLLLLGGLIGLHARQAGAYGRVGDGGLLAGLPGEPARGRVVALRGGLPDEPRRWGWRISSGSR